MDKEQWKVVPVERSYDMRVQSIIAFNTAEKAGKDRDDAMDDAFQAMLAAAPQPPSASGEREAALLRLMPEVLASLRADGMNVSLVADLERAIAAPSPGIDAAEQKPVADGETSAILQWIMKQAEAAKEPCGDDPESRAAVRNSKLAAIASAAAQALGMVCGPSYAAPSAAQPDGEWLAEAERLVDAYAKEFAQGGATYARDIRRAALLDHLKVRT